MSKKVIISVTNDLVSDKRVNKVALSLLKFGYDVTVVGRVLPNSLAVKFPYAFKRFRLPFKTGMLFYASYNIRLFFFLLFSKADVFLSNDLDSLVANYLASVLKRKKLVYDSHELFTEVPELTNRIRTKKVWLAIEGFILPKVKFAYTVCDSIAQIYNEKYGINMLTVRNIPEKQTENKARSKPELIANETRKIILYQGALNEGRGLEFAISSMQYIDNAILLIAGGGDVEDNLHKQVADLKLVDKVYFTGRLPFAELSLYTKYATIGLSLEENYSLNYYYALPNKLFDYIRSGVPVLVSKLPEIARIVNKYDIGEYIENHEPKHIAFQLKKMLSDDELQKKWRNNLKVASDDLSWENEEKELEKIFCS